MSFDAKMVPYKFNKYVVYGIGCTSYHCYDWYWVTKRKQINRACLQDTFLTTLKRFCSWSCGQEWKKDKNGQSAKIIEFTNSDSDSSNLSQLVPGSPEGLELSVLLDLKFPDFQDETYDFSGSSPKALRKRPGSQHSMKTPCFQRLTAAVHPWRWRCLFTKGGRKGI